MKGRVNRALTMKELRANIEAEIMLVDNHMKDLIKTNQEDELPYHRGRRNTLLHILNLISKPE